MQKNDPQNYDTPIKYFDVQNTQSDENIFSFSLPKSEPLRFINPNAAKKIPIHESLMKMPIDNESAHSKLKMKSGFLNHKRGIF